MSTAVTLRSAEEKDKSNLIEIETMIWIYENSPVLHHYDIINNYQQAK